MTRCRYTYIPKKQLALQSGLIFRRYVWHRRYIMLKCILVTVRQWLPHPEDVPCMGHMEIIMYVQKLD